MFNLIMSFTLILTRARYMLTSTGCLFPGESRILLIRRT